MIINVIKINNNIIDSTTNYGLAKGRWVSKEIPLLKAYAVEFVFDRIIESDSISFCKSK